MSAPGSFKAYKVTNRLNGRAYIGITTQKLRRRWNRHTSTGHGYLGAAIKKHGAGQFVIEHIASARDWASLCALEQVLIAQERTFVRNGGYNITLGGGGSHGHTVPSDVRAKIAASKTGLVIPAEIRHKISLAKTGRKLSQETRAKMVAAHAHRPPPTAEAIAKRAAAITGQRRSAETRAKVSAARRAQEAAKRTPEGRQGRLEL